MSILVTVLRVISEELQNNDPKMRIICINVYLISLKEHKNQESEM